MDEDIIYFLKVVEVALIASIKLLFAPFEAERQGFNFRDAFFITTTGGFAGILAFTFVSEIIIYTWRKTVHFFRKPLGNEEAPKKKFTLTNKFIVRTKMRFGLIGLLIVTPSIISIPVGTIVVNRFYRKSKARNIILLFLSVALWSFLLNGIAQYVRFSNYLPH